MKPKCRQDHSDSNSPLANDAAEGLRVSLASLRRCRLEKRGQFVILMPEADIRDKLIYAYLRTGLIVTEKLTTISHPGIDVFGIAP